MFGHFAGLADWSSSGSRSPRGDSSAVGDLPSRVGSEWRGAQRSGALISLAARRAEAASMAGDPAGSGAGAAPAPPARATPSP
eukprot:573840-Alexandrium_andersonii.AAC.1